MRVTRDEVRARLSEFNTLTSARVSCDCAVIVWRIMCVTLGCFDLVGAEIGLGLQLMIRVVYI